MKYEKGGIIGQRIQRERGMRKKEQNEERWRRPLIEKEKKTEG